MWLDQERGMALDARYLGGEARFMNHRCDGGNCQARKWQDGKGRARIGIYATRAIAKGEELTYDYEQGELGVRDEEEGLGFECGCGSQGCPSRKRGEKAARKAKEEEAKDEGGLTAAMGAFTRALEVRHEEWTEYREEKSTRKLEDWKIRMEETEQQEILTEMAEQQSHGSDQSELKRGGEGQAGRKESREERDRGNGDMTIEARVVGEMEQVLQG